MLTGVRGTCSTAKNLAQAHRLLRCHTRNNFGTLATIRPGQKYKERKGLRLRSQVYMLCVVALFVVIANAVICLWFTTATDASRSRRCAFSLHTKDLSDGSCSIDGVAVMAMVVGLFAMLLVFRVLWCFCHAPLVRLPGEEHSKCHMDNALEAHSSTSSTMAKGMGGLVVGFELLVALIPLHPYFYLLGIAPTAAAGVTAMQAYLKV